MKTKKKIGILFGHNLYIGIDTGDEKFVKKRVTKFQKRLEDLTSKGRYREVEAKLAERYGIPHKTCTNYENELSDNNG